MKMATNYITFSDGNVIVSTTSHDFCVHRGLLCISSGVWQKALESGMARGEGAVKVSVTMKAGNVEVYMQALYGMYVIELYSGYREACSLNLCLGLP